MHEKEICANVTCELCKIKLGHVEAVKEMCATRKGTEDYSWENNNLLNSSRGTVIGNGCTSTQHQFIQCQ